ncbi:MAG: 5-dehydro-4-deoxy-D-glucuronate isomerase [Clostridia bacterium]|nr:5-dehydro-4-deoxy-D-glucuronate isomerase [Clostridia bacterium]
MQVRYSSSPEAVRGYDTDAIRREFLIEDLFAENSLNLVYSHIDRIIVGGCVPVEPVSLPSGEALHGEYFLERREMGVINIGGPARVKVDEAAFELRHKDGLYIGMGAKDVVFESVEASNPARIYINSTPAHRTCPTALIRPEDCVRVELGSIEQSNHRMITKYILPGQIESCQLVMGMTSLKPGNVWNSMPCHTHERRMEVYLYFELDEDSVVFHYMGQPDETRHIVMRNEQAVISPSWSIHCGCGTSNYTFIWGMAGENQTFDDMDGVKATELK